MTSPSEEPTTVPPDPVAHAVETSTRRPVRIWDVIITAILLLALAGFTVIVATFGLYLAETVNTCRVSACDSVLVAIGMALATVVPWILLGVAVIGSILLLVRRRMAFWVPIVAAVLILIVWFIGGGVATWGVYSV